MARKGLSEEQQRQRIRDQIDLIRDDHGDGVSWDSDDPEDFRYLYDPQTLLVRSDDRDRVEGVIEILNASGDFVADVVEEELPRDRSDRPPLDLVRVVLPGRRDGDPRQVPLALDVLDEQQVNDTETVATPDHWLHLSPVGNTRLCPAIEPEPTGRAEPWPGVTEVSTRGEGVLVCVVDSGWHATAAGSSSAAAGWLGGVDGDPEPAGTMLRPYAGHGTFIAGVVRCLAPSAKVYVERFLAGGAAMRESDMVRQLRESLQRDPRIINLSAGATTRQDRPLLSFERFWKRDLAETENCLLVAAAGNDGSSRSFWPAAFEWAIGVGSLNRGGKVSSFSNYRDSADVYAVGRRLVNAYPIGTYTCRETPDKGEHREFTTGLARWSGTSFAAPVVAGLIAAELTGGGDVHAAWAAVLGRAGSVIDPDGATVPAFLPPYT